MLNKKYRKTVKTYNVCLLLCGTVAVILFFAGMWLPGSFFLLILFALPVLRVRTEENFALYRKIEEYFDGRSIYNHLEYIVQNRRRQRVYLYYGTYERFAAFRCYFRMLPCEDPLYGAIGNFMKKAEKRGKLKTNDI